MIKVKNLLSTGDRKPNGYYSWIEFWEAKTDSKATRCGAIDCRATNNLVGAHVIKAISSDNRWYIVPLCKGCNNRTDEFYVDLQLVPVNQ